MEQVTIEFLKDARNTIDELNNEGISNYIEKLVKTNDEWRFRCLNLNAAESVMSPMARKALNSDLNTRTTNGEIGARHHMGGKYIDQIEALAIELAKKLFRVEHVEHRPITTSIANGIAIRVNTEVGDTIMALEEPRGHPTCREKGYPGYRGLKIVDIPFNYNEWNIDIDKLVERIHEIKPKPKLMTLGTSVFLFPHPLREIREIADEIGAKIMYDAAHVLGLIAGKAFQDPLKEGADFMTGTISKTLSGPLGGLIVHNDAELDKRIRSAIYNHLAATGLSRSAAMAITFAEMLEFGEAFARQIIRNAQKLAQKLDEVGFDVVGRKKGYTRSHTIVFDVKYLGGGDEVAKKLEDANIICSAYKLWSAEEPWYGIRLGVTEMTRYGMKEHEMNIIAEYIRRVVIDKEDPKKIAKNVSIFRRQFKDVQYCFSFH